MRNHLNFSLSKLDIITNEFEFSINQFSNEFNINLKNPADLNKVYTTNCVFTQGKVRI